jgi:predicted O-methyltransferase YrrM
MNINMKDSKNNLPLITEGIRSFRWDHLFKEKNMNKIKDLDWKLLHSMGEIPEFEKLERWANECRDKGGARALEIGSFHGKSTALIAQFFNPTYAVDLWSNVDDGMNSYVDIGQQHFVPFIQNMIKLKLIDHVIPIVGTSSVLDSMPYLDLDFIYIDASHYYKDVKKDIECAVRHLSKVGVIVGDDYKRPGWGYPPYDPNHPHHGPNDPWSGVARAFDEFLDQNPTGFQMKEHYLGKILISRK